VHGLLEHPVQGTEKAVISSFVSKIPGVFENWSFFSLFFCISFAIKVIKKGKTVSGRSFLVYVVIHR